MKLNIHQLTTRQSARRISGFSLVEVTLAIGITAVALVSLMGMIPRGLATLRKAGDQAVMARIHQQIMGELQLVPWEGSGGNTLESFDKAIRKYDDQGIELQMSARDNGGGKDHIYTARISLPASNTQLPKSVGGGIYGGVRLPGDSASDDQVSRLVLVEITSSLDPRFLSDPKSGFDRLENRSGVYVYRSVLSRMDANKKL